MTYLPTFQPQNPAISGYPLGWASCTAFSAAMQIDSATKGAKKPTGGQVRTFTGDTVGGLNLAQVDAVATDHYGVNLDVRYNYPWSEFIARVKAGETAQLQGGYGPIADSVFDAGNGFRGNHDIFVASPALIVMDPLADGRFPNVYKYHGQAYPEDLLKRFAGKLDLNGMGDLLGYGLVYAAFSPILKQWYATIRPAGTAFTRYFVANTKYGLQIRGREHRTTAKGFSLPCTAPRDVWERPVGDGAPTLKRSIVEVAGPSPAYDNFWVDSKWAEEK